MRIKGKRISKDVIRIQLAVDLDDATFIRIRDTVESARNLAAELLSLWAQGGIEIPEYRYARRTRSDDGSRRRINGKLPRIWPDGMHADGTHDPLPPIPPPSPEEIKAIPSCRHGKRGRPSHKAEILHIVRWELQRIFGKID